MGLANSVILLAGNDVLIAWMAGVVTSTSPRLSSRTARILRAERHGSFILFIVSVSFAMSRSRFSFVSKSSDVDNPVNNAARTHATRQWQDNDAAANFPYRLGLWQLFVSIVAAFDVDMGAQRADKFSGSIFIKDDNMIHRIKGRDEGHTVALAINRAVHPLETPRAVIAVDPNHQHITQCLCLA